MNNKLTHEESLEIITSVIATTKGNISQGAFHAILWGWVVMGVSFTHFLLIKYQLISHPEIVWLLMIPTLLVSLAVGFKKGKMEIVRTPIDAFYKWIWFGLVFTMSLMIYFLFGEWRLISPMVLLIAGYATFLSGKLIKFKPMIIGGISFWFWAVIAYLAGPYYALLVVSAGILTGYLIPGIMLQQRKNEFKTS